MKKCYDCTHVEMCGWRREVKEQGCEFFDDGPVWIPVSERMPSVDGDAYLVTDYCTQINHRRTRIAYCYANKDGFWSNTPKGYEVVAWMPLPPAYQGE